MFCVLVTYAGCVARETKLKSTAAFQSPLLGSGITWAWLPPLGEICGHTTSEQIVQFSCECIALQYTTYVQHMQFMTYNVLLKMYVRDISREKRDCVYYVLGGDGSTGPGGTLSISR